VGHAPLVHPSKIYGPGKKKLCNKYLKLGFNHPSSDRNVRANPINPLNNIHDPPLGVHRPQVKDPCPRHKRHQQDKVCFVLVAKDLRKSALVSC